MIMGRTNPNVAMIPPASDSYPRSCPFRLGRSSLLQLPCAVWVRYHNLQQGFP